MWWTTAYGLPLCFFFNYALQPFKAYCAIWVRRSNFRHQTSPRASPRESTQRRKVELWARKCPGIVPKCRYLHVVKLRHGTDGFTSPPKALKIRRLRPGANPPTWVPKASTLPLDHRNRFAPTLLNDWASNETIMIREISVLKKAMFHINP